MMGHITRFHGYTYILLYICIFVTIKHIMNVFSFYTLYCKGNAEMLKNQS